MSIEAIVEQALEDGYLTPTMETEVSKISDKASPKLATYSNPTPLGRWGVGNFSVLLEVLKEKGYSAWVVS